MPWETNFRLRCSTIGQWLPMIDENLKCFLSWILRSLALCISCAVTSINCKASYKSWRVLPLSTGLRKILSNFCFMFALMNTFQSSFSRQNIAFVFAFAFRLVTVWTGLSYLRLKERLSSTTGRCLPSALSQRFGFCGETVFNQKT